MTSPNLDRGDERDAGFGAPERLAHHKPGFDLKPAKPEAEHDKDNRRQPKDAKEIPQTPLAKRLRRATKGEK